MSDVFVAVVVIVIVVYVLRSYFEQRVTSFLVSFDPNIRKTNNGMEAEKHSQRKRQIQDDSPGHVTIKVTHYGGLVCLLELERIDQPHCQIREEKK